jgi:hypothetical protein
MQHVSTGATAAERDASWLVGIDFERVTHENYRQRTERISA